MYFVECNVINDEITFIDLSGELLDSHLVYLFSEVCNVDELSRKQ